MASILFTVGGAVVNALAFSGTNFVFIRLTDHGAEELNRDLMKRLDFMSKNLGEKNEARTYISNVDEAMLEQCRVFARKIRPVPPEPELLDFYHPSELQKMMSYHLL